MTRKIAFVRKGRVPLASDHVARVLQENFPGLEVEIIDMKQMLNGRRDIELINLFHTLKAYGADITAGRKEIRSAFFRTTYLFRKIKSLMADRLSRTDYLFSFQMQSLYDASAQGVPHFVYTDHTNLANLRYPLQDHHRLYSDEWVRLERTIYQNAAHVFTRSRNITRSIVEQYDCDPERVTCVYAGSNVCFDDTLPANDGYRNKNVLFVGIDWERKGGPDLVAAFRRVRQSHPDARLTVVGCTPDVSLPNCEIVGRVSLEEMDRYYRQASVFCLPTRLEPFGIAFIEAFAHRLPIVATRVGAIPDFVIPHESGFLVESGDRQALAEALIALLDDPDRCRAFGERGYRLVRRKYTWEQVGRSLRKHIAEILDLSGGAT